MKRKFKLIPLLLAAVMALTACSGSKDASADAEAAATVTPVEVMEATAGSISKTLTYVGKVAANDSITVTPKISGQVKEVLVDVGDTVTKDQVLLIIDDKDLKDQISTTEAQLKIAEAGVASAQAVLDQVTNGGQTETQKVALETAVKNARINVDNAKISMENAQTGVDNAKISVDTTQSAFNDTEKKYNDYKTMLAAGVITQSEFDSIELGYTQAKNALDQVLLAYSQAQNSLNQTQLAYNSAVATLEQAEESLRLYNEKTLDDSETSARNALKSAQASRDSVLASLNILKSNLQYIEVKSPINGVITSRNVEETYMVSAASAPFVVSDSSTVTVDVDISERIINLINIGQQIDVNINSVYDAPVKGTIRTIDPAAGSNGSYTVKIELPNTAGQLKAGMIAHVSFTESSADNVVVVPRSTIIEADDTAYVFIANGNKAEKREVELGIDDGEFIQISNVEFGEQIIASGQNYVSDGGVISIIDPEAEESENSETTSGKEE